MKLFRQLKFNCYQLKMDCFIDETFYVSLLVTTKQKPRIGSQKIQKGERKHTTMKGHQFTKLRRNRKT